MRSKPIVLLVALLGLLSGPLVTNPSDAAGASRMDPRVMCSLGLLHGVDHQLLFASTHRGRLECSPIVAQASEAASSG
jgi:hypothetical protein